MGKRKRRELWHKTTHMNCDNTHINHDIKRHTLIKMLEGRRRDQWRCETVPQETARSITTRSNKYYLWHKTAHVNNDTNQHILMATYETTRQAAARFDAIRNSSESPHRSKPAPSAGPRAALLPLSGRAAARLCLKKWSTIIIIININYYYYYYYY